ncbi:hypothetical protein BRADI_3g45367v3 [Brachypodium distachyon]|uniref:Uncharacterized protein n=2 Tax=Brachypodium distachyon TaxID=15368 RepID=A0A2K2D3F9_BRADI|nr:hypothetical protein BRADI_3g45367v3 [Brachypodium distachyon]
MTQARKNARPKVFHANGRSAPPPPVPPPAPAAQPPAMQPPPGWRPSPNYKGKNPFYRLPNSAAPSIPCMPSTSPIAWHAPTQDPWTGLVQPWPLTWNSALPPAWTPAPPPAWTTAPRPHTGSPGLLGSRPPANAFHAYTNGAMYQTPSAPSAPPYQMQPQSYPVQPPPYPTQTPSYQYQQVQQAAASLTATIPLYQAAQHHLERPQLLPRQLRH